MVLFHNNKNFRPYTNPISSSMHEVQVNKKGDTKEFISEPGLIEKVEICYDSDHNRYYINVLINYIDGGSQSAIIILDRKTSFSKIKLIFELLDVDDMKSMKNLPIIALKNDGWIKGLMIKGRYMIFND